ncbi:hypothetical protein F5I97DRAFT_1787212, partial [Phlebopus sp. FC_14]
WFLQQLHVFFSLSIVGHSMHAGGTTSLAAAGVPPVQIANAFECYICKTLALL